jgi:hypothetical protein
LLGISRRAKSPESEIGSAEFSRIPNTASWWDHKAAYNISHFARTAMLRPPRASSMKAEPITSLIPQFAGQSPTGIMLVSKGVDAT